MAKKIWDVTTILVAAALMAAAFNMLLIPHQLLSGGLSGVSMIIGYLTNWNISLLYLLSNLPVLVWGLIVIGRRFIVLSVISVIATTGLMQIFPVQPLLEDPLLAAVFGGVIVGAATGVSLRYGGSTGGFDIIGSIVTRKRDFPLGLVLFALNSVVIVALGYFKNDWDLALSSMLSIFIAGKMVDIIHVRHVKLTLFIITEHKDKMLKQLLVLPRGVTLLEATGAYTNRQQTMLMTVTTRYELAELKKIIRETDPKAFVNMVETMEVMGEFRRIK